MDLTKSTYGELLTIQDVLGPLSAKDLRLIPKPRRLLRVEIPETIDHLTIGELLFLQASAEQGEEAFIGAICKVLLKGKSVSRLMRTKAYLVQGFVNWFTSEMERVNTLFSSVGRKLSNEELRAGFGKSNAGGFGLIDWYARRMGITNHEEAELTPWPRVYKCLAIDAEHDEKNRRLQAIRASEAKAKQRR